MILDRYPQLNKGVTAILSAEPNAMNPNCYYGNRCKPYAIPINADYTDHLYWYAIADSAIQSYKIYAANCNGQTQQLQPLHHVAGTDTNGGIYFMFHGLQSLPAYEKFQLWLELTYTNNKVRSFFSGEYELEQCSNMNIVLSCASATDNGGFNVNGAYLGEPLNPKTFDNTGYKKLRYFNNYTLRDLKALYAGSQSAYTSFNNRAVKNERTTTYAIYCEVLPYWYEQQVATAFDGGYVYIDGAYYKISEFKSDIVGDPCCERLSLDIKAIEVRTFALSCSKDCSFENIIETEKDCALGVLSYEVIDSGLNCNLGNLTYEII